MSQTLDRPDAETTSAPRRVRLGLGLSPTAAATLLSLTISRLIASKRMASLLGLYLLPIVLLLLIRQTRTILRPEEVELVVVFNLFPHTLLPLAALLFAPGLIQDEVEEQTLTYLLVRPLPRWLIYLVKLAASIFVTALLAAAFAGLVELVVWWDDPDLARIVPVRAGRLAGIFALAMTTYNALFGFVGLIIRKSLAFGVFYLVVFEGILASLDFVFRRVTVMFYVRDLAIRWLGLPNGNWKILKETAPGAGECVATLLIAAAALATLAAIVFTTREFRVKTPEAT